MMPRTPHLRNASLALLVAAVFPGVALAQDASPEGFDAHGFHLVAFDGDPRDLLAVARPGRMTPKHWFIGGVFEYAEAPLSYTVSDATGGNARTVTILDNLMALNLSAGVTLHERVRLDVGAPLFLSSVGLGDVSQGAGLGDLRIGGMVSLLPPASSSPGGLGLGVVPWLDVPTGDATEFTGAPGVGGGAALAGTYELEKLTFTGSAGMAFNPEIQLENLSNSDNVLAGVGAGWLFQPRSSLNAESTFQLPLTKSPEPGSATHTEVLLSLRHRWSSGVHVLAGGAIGVGDGAETAPYRAFLGAGFGRVAETVVDRDQDGILDKADACPSQPETVNKYKDQDGCPDSLATLEVLVFYEEAPFYGAPVKVEGGEEPATFESGVNSFKVETPPKKRWTASASQGCLSGEASVVAHEGENQLVVNLEPKVRGTVQYVAVSKGDRKPIPSVEIKVQSQPDYCGVERPLTLGSGGTGEHTLGAGEHTIFATAPEFGMFRVDLKVAPGSDQTVQIELEPARTQVTQTQIVILEKVFFDTDRATIKDVSFPLLDQVAIVLAANPQIERVEVAGHTDSQGDDGHNLVLSDERSKSVRAYLIAKGVEASRLQAQGYGESRPLAPNSTANGRAENRRVEFNILDTGTKAEP